MVNLMIIDVYNMFQDILVYIAQYGVTTSDIFRRPGNSSELKYIEKRLMDGKEIKLANYNFFTLASVVKVSFHNSVFDAYN